MADPSAEDVQTYCARQQQAQAVAQRFNEMPRATEVDPADAVRASLDTAQADLTRDGAQIETGYLAALDSMRDISSRIATGDFDVDEAKKQLAQVRQQLSSLNKSASRASAQSAAVDARRADPAAYAEALLDKYPALRGRG